MNDPRQVNPKQVVIFSLDEPRYALCLSVVERVVRAVEIAPLPKAPQIILGIINVQGQVIPVVDTRRRLGLLSRKISPDDQFILARTSRRFVALVVDSVRGIHELTDPEFAAAKQIQPDAEYIHGVAKLNDNLILICDLDQFLSLNDEEKLDKALAENAPQTDGRTNQKSGESK